MGTDSTNSDKKLFHSLAISKAGKQYLEKGIVTGMMRIANELNSSVLNNLGVYTLLSKEFDDKFGFTEQELESLLTDFQLLDRYDEIQEWYNGYRFGTREFWCQAKSSWQSFPFLETAGQVAAMDAAGEKVVGKNRDFES